MNVYSCLVVCRCREYLALLGRDRCVSLNQLCSDAAKCLDRQRQRSNIQEKDIACACIACKLTALNGSAECYTLIRVEALVRLMTRQLFYLILYSRDTCGTTD